ncbi:hypothetical protein F2Q70_00035513 [Brassica cretica]|uniref:Uncharacterized protein n=1 Tax=Brassica cretica TaxID=69181 RepID=A0A8S9JU32_BRACR|nr:hypothetical protein F2Q70_00035513 [Brassica cretica]
MGNSLAYLMGKRSLLPSINLSSLHCEKDAQLEDDFQQEAEESIYEFESLFKCTVDENLILRSEEQAKTVNVGVKIGYDGINAGKSLRNLSKRRIKNEKLDLRIFKTITRQAPRKGAIKPTSSDPPSGKLDKPRPIRPMASWIDQSNTPSGE